MPTWVIVGASRGLGLAWVEYLVKHTDFTVVATVRDLSKTPGLFADYKGRVEVIELDIFKQDSIKVGAGGFDAGMEGWAHVPCRTRQAGSTPVSPCQATNSSCFYGRRLQKSLRICFLEALTSCSTTLATPALASLRTYFQRERPLPPTAPSADMIQDGALEILETISSWLASGW
jgi:hypothetical protein